MRQTGVERWQSVRKVITAYASIVCVCGNSQSGWHRSGNVSFTTYWECASPHLNGKYARSNNDVLSYSCASVKGHFLNGYECLYLMWSLTVLAARVCLVLQGHTHALYTLIYTVYPATVSGWDRKTEERQARWQEVIWGLRGDPQEAVAAIIDPNAIHWLCS